MHDANTWYFFKSYIKDHKKVVIFFLLVILIFLIIIGLHRLPLVAVGYAALLCLVFGIIFVIYDFYFYQKRNKEIMGMSFNIAYTIEGLPEGKTFTEKNYEHLLSILYGYSEESKSKAFKSRQDMMDYYTMWVHQIKTPIAAMKLLLQSSNRDMPDQLQKELKNELFKIEQYVDMVLSYMRLESDSTDYIFKEYDLDHIIKQAVKKYSTQFINNKIKLDFQETGLKVLTDEKWLGFALEQILSNAIKYTESGSVTIKKIKEPTYCRDDMIVDADNMTVNDDDNVANITEDNVMINNTGTTNKRKTIIIEDTGIGIASEDLPRIFEKGFTGYNGRIQKKSTGIGLFLTKKILTKLGHTIIIDSNPGEGTRVTLDLTSEYLKHE